MDSDVLEILVYNATTAPALACVRETRSTMDPLVVSLADLFQDAQHRTNTLEASFS